MAEKKLMYGNHAVVEGVIAAGCRFFAGYPITPQNEIPELMSIRMNEIGGVFVQTESEISAINMLFGAAAAGKRAMTSSLTSATTRSTSSAAEPSGHNKNSSRITICNRYCMR